jgi:hypothetical protein
MNARGSRRPSRSWGRCWSANSSPATWCSRQQRAVGLRLTAGQAARFVPLAGQAVSALVGYSAIRYLGEEHLKDCVRIALKAELRLPYQPDNQDATSGS